MSDLSQHLQTRHLGADLGSREFLEQVRNQMREQDWRSYHAFSEETLELLRGNLESIVLWGFEIDWEIPRDLVEERFLELLTDLNSCFKIESAFRVHEACKHEVD